MSTHEADAFLMGGGVPAIKFDEGPPGPWHTGVVLDYERRQQTDFGTKTPLTWPDGSPKWQIVITLKTEYRDPTVEHDNGMRKLYVKGQSMTAAVRDAVRAAGQDRLGTGGTLAVRWIANDEASGGGMPAKLYEARFKPGAPSTDPDEQSEPVVESAPPPPPEDYGEEPF